MFASFLSSYGERFMAVGGRTPPLPVFNEPLTSKGRLFTHPCGTPLDIAFSKEVVQTRRVYWGDVVTRLGGRIIPLQSARQSGTATIIVPDSRLWLPSACTLDLLAHETFTSSVVGEEWLELCYHRQYILPPAYVRMLMVAEYFRMSMAPQWHTDRVQSLALIPGEWVIPTTANTGLRRAPYKFDIFKLFSSPVSQWFRGSPLVLNLTNAGEETSIGSLFLASFTLGSPYSAFNEENWDSYFWMEVALIRSTKSLFRKAHGYWPCQPFDQYQTPYVDKPIDQETAEKIRQQWFPEMLDLMVFKGTDTSELPDRSTDTRLSPTTLSVITQEDGTVSLGVVAGTILNTPKRAKRRGSNRQDAAANPHQRILSELETSDTLRWAAAAAERAEALLMEDAAVGIAREEAAKLAPDEPFCSAPLTEDIQLGDYVDFYEQIFPSKSPEQNYKISRSILTALKPDAVNISHRIQNPPENQLKAHPDLCFSLDIDSTWASFRVENGWPFIDSCSVQIYAVGPWARRVVGSSKFRIDPGDGKCLAWGARVPMHHFPNTEFMTVGAKTSVYAVFPKLRDISPGHKHSVLSKAHTAAWYDCVVRPAAVKVFGEVLTRHWALNYANHLWRDRHQGRSSHSRYALPQSDDDSMTQFLRAIDQIVNDAPEDSLISDFRGVFYVIQCQNDKLQYREDDVLGDDPALAPDNFTAAVERVQSKALQMWKTPYPPDTHVDIGLEISCRDPTVSPYVLSTGHSIMLQDCLDMTPDNADKMVQLTGRNHEHHQYHRHDVACISSLAGFDWVTEHEHDTQIRAVKVYHTEKGYTFKRNAPKHLQQPSKSCWLWSNASLDSHFRNIQSTLRSAAHLGANAVRIEFTLPVDRVPSCAIFPSLEFIRHITKLDASLLARYRSLKLKAIQYIHTHMVCGKSFQGVLQRSGPLSVLALLRWYHEGLFTRVSPLFWKDRDLFTAMIGSSEPEFLFSAGQLVFGSSLLPYDPNRCPNVPKQYTLGEKALLNQFGLHTKEEIEKFVVASRRSKGNSNPRQTLREILAFTTLPSAPLSSIVQQRYPGSLILGLGLDLGGDMDNDNTLEAIFVGMVRTIWASVPSTRSNHKDTPITSAHIDIDDVCGQWGPQELRKAPAVISRYFRLATWDENAGEVEWNSMFSRMFGEMKDGQWADDPVPQAVQKRGYFIPWEALMKVHSEDSQIQSHLHRLMFAKFNTLRAFPKLLATGTWQRKAGNIDGAGAIRGIVLLRSPHQTGLADIWRSAGYMGIDEDPDVLRLSMRPDTANSSHGKLGTPKRAREPEAGQSNKRHKTDDTKEEMIMMDM